MSGLEIVGAVGAIINIIDGISKTISTIHAIQSKWADADLTVLSLAVQLATLRAALTKIEEWLDGDAEMHHQLTMDVDTSIAGCHLLMSKLDILFNGVDELGR